MLRDLCLESQSLLQVLESQGCQYPLPGEFSSNHTPLLEGEGTKDSVEGMRENEVNAGCAEVVGLERIKIGTHRAWEGAIPCGDSI